MRNLMLLTVLIALVSPIPKSAQAIEMSPLAQCNTAAGDLQGDARGTFMMDCLRKLRSSTPAEVSPMVECSATATAGDLHGDARKAFMKECLGRPRPPTAAQAAIQERAKKPGVKLGMTMNQVVTDTNWGAPDSVNHTITKYGERQQWVYQSGFLYFDRGVLTGIQSTEK